MESDARLMKHLTFRGFCFTSMHNILYIKFLKKASKLTEEKTPHLLICTARFSDNLGDGVIGDCLEYLMLNYNPQLNISHIDIAGRTQYELDANQKKNPYKNIFYKLPPFTRSWAVLLTWPVLTLPKLRESWKDSVPDQKFSLVFGGGQLLSDVALNFPLKFYYITQRARKREAIIAVNAIGVSEKWSFIARHLFRKSLSCANIVSISARDRKSLDNLQGHVSLPAPITETIDPGIFAADVYKISGLDHEKQKNKHIGIGIAHPHELATQAENCKNFEFNNALNFWGDIINKIKNLGYTPVLFTNGAKEDEEFLQKVKEHIKEDLVFLERPLTPHDLVRNISDFHGIISHRLHANIVAYSLGIPSVSLIWDTKVHSFCKLAQREQWCLQSDAAPDDVVACLESALLHGVDQVKLKELKRTLEQDIQKLMSYIQNG